MPSQTSWGSWGGGSPAGDPAAPQIAGGPLNFPLTAPVIATPGGGASQPVPVLSVPQTVAPRTPLAGASLINGLTNFISATTPNDGQAHLVLIGLVLVVTTLETGGQITLAFTSLATAVSTIAFAAGLGVSNNIFSTLAVCDPNTQVNVNQSSALTAGAAKLAGIITVID